MQTMGKYVVITIAILVGAVLLFLALDHLMKKYKKPFSAEDAIWKAVYFIQIKQYEQALLLLENAEKDYAIFPEEMCDLCIQKAEALQGLERYNDATDAYESLYEALGQCERGLKRNDALLAELKGRYAKADRLKDFEKWEQLFAKENIDALD